MQLSSTEGKHYNFTTPAGGSTGEISQYITNIIESNTGTQVDVRVGYTHTTKSGGVVTQVNKYVDNTMTQKVYQIDFTWNVDGTPNVITRINLDDNITETIVFEWVDGVANINRSVL